jgi:HK97 family phage portal protein
MAEDLTLVRPSLPQTAMQTSAVNSCVRLLSESIASMSPILYEKVGNERQEALSSPLHDLLCLQPNQDSSAFTLWDSFVASIALTGNLNHVIIYS